jgi:NADPH:quinone reductase-like Zn-dependent oxidoreductase
MAANVACRILRSIYFNFAIIPSPSLPPLLLSSTNQDQAMPTVAPHTGSLVLVTGANGYIAMHVVDQLLKAGYTVRGTVRSVKKGEHLQATFAAYGDKLEIVIVDDITRVSVETLVGGIS